ncbi:MAG: tetratricopeptide repeat protein [Planctomycetes bacterium]|nr:tetratricopeptide repeat protein [Planctomycetota bacterium]
MGSTQASSSRIPKARAPGQSGLAALARGAPLLVFLLACLPFLPVAGFGFVAWDDDLGLANNPSWRGLGAEQLRWMFTTFTLGHWQPLAWMSFGLEHELWGLRPERMHQINFGLHGLNAVLFFLVARRVLLALPGALFAALFFALHPLRVEAAAWIIERGHLLATALLLLSLLAWLRARASPAGRSWRALSLALFVLSLLSKAWGIALPAVLWILQDGLDRREGARPPWRSKLALWPFVLIAAASLAFELLAKPGNVDVPSLQEHGLLGRLVQAGVSVFQFVAHTCWPAGLSPLYEFRPGFDGGDVVRALAVLFATAACCLARRRFPGSLHAWAGCLVLLLPVSGLLQSGLQGSADRYTYLAAMPCAIWLGALFGRLWVGRVRPVVASLAALWLCALAVVSAGQVQVWRDSESLWRRVVLVDPESFIGWHNLGTTLHAEGRPLEALECERRSVELEPGPRNRDSRFHLGQLELIYGDRERAKAAWRVAIEQDPGDLRYLEWLDSQQANGAARRALWSLALESSPNNLLVRSKLEATR